MREPKRRQELARAAGGQIHVAKAPLIIAAVATMPEYVMRCGVPAYAVDLAIAVDHMTLAAVDEGLGTCWIGAFSQEKARNILKVPGGLLDCYSAYPRFPKANGRTKNTKTSR